ncbi:MAG: LysR family transcriptional regulator [Candidatus Anaerobiospirillum merdipullorum]|uniref:LysR family transcriptional regulator n=1 Tax=Candidatus Anaerobiospirillum merdipullorum TaxID=2838450 RepID=A0A9E2NSX1_9GAMM|nr:LysR family transcriptional regulator [Candidatus Anaerobiospirillum merdipullorum]
MDGAAIKLIQLQAVLLSARLGSFSQAARHMGRAQSAVSTYVHDVELDLGFPLFERGHKLKLTPRGALLLPQMQKLYDDNVLFAHRARELYHLSHPTLRLGIDFSIYNKELFIMLRALADAYPALQLRLSPISSFDVQTFMGDFSLDAALYFNHSQNLPYACLTLGTVVNRVIVATDHPLAQQREITRADLSSYRQIVMCSNLSSKHKGITLSPLNWEVDNFYYALSLVASGVGFAVVPEILIATEHDFFGLLTCLDDSKLDFPDATMSLIWQDGIDKVEPFAFLRDKLCAFYQPRLKNISLFASSGAYNPPDRPRYRP